VAGAAESAPKSDPFQEIHQRVKQQYKKGDRSLLKIK